MRVISFIIPSCTLLAVLLSVNANAQDLPEVESRVYYYLGELAKSKTDAEMDTLSSQIRNLFLSCINHPETFDYPFSRLKMCTIISPDNKFRLLNWNQPLRDGTHKYYGFVLLKDDKGIIHWLELKHTPDRKGWQRNKFYTHDNWPGALYYDIVPMGKKGRSENYILLAWDGADNMTNKKLVDVIQIKKDRVRFGGDVFEGEEGIGKRIILEYSNGVSASLKYYPKGGYIVYDHLSPRNPAMVGIFSDYGPDGSYDALKFEKGKWKLISNIEVNRFAPNDNAPYKNPGDN
ncbi:MAG: hypothetical protein ACKOW8_04175 [Flavobacteriales bacterium]